MMTAGAGFGVMTGGDVAAGDPNAAGSCGGTAV
jgi:hypothetical protein